MIGVDPVVCIDRRSVPGYHLLDASVIPKDDATTCEDAIVLTDSHVAVIDGMTAGLGNDGACTEPPGRVAAARIAAATLSLPPEATAGDAVRLYTAALEPDSRNHGDVLFGASIVCLSVHHREIWRVGDCHLRIGTAEHFGDKAVDQANASYRAAINHAALAAGATVNDLRVHDPGRLATGPLIDAQRRLANHTGSYGYGVLNGTAVPGDFIETFRLGAGAADVTFMSDGYPSFGRDLAAAERHLLRILDRDPACIDELARMAKSWKPGSNGPDDRSYVRVHLPTAGP